MSQIFHNESGLASSDVLPIHIQEQLTLQITGGMTSFRVAARCDKDAPWGYVRFNDGATDQLTAADMAPGPDGINNVFVGLGCARYTDIRIDIDGAGYGVYFEAC